MSDSGIKQLRIETEHAAHLKSQYAALVLRYPDIAAKLKSPPLSLSDPRHWTGFIPGPYMPEDARGCVRPNESPVRAQLLAILQEAAERADGAQRIPAQCADPGEPAIEEKTP